MPVFLSAFGYSSLLFSGGGNEKIENKKKRKRLEKSHTMPPLSEKDTSSIWTDSFAPQKSSSVHSKTPLKTAPVVKVYEPESYKRLKKDMTSFLEACPNYQTQSLVRFDVGPFVKAAFKQEYPEHKQVESQSLEHFRLLYLTEKGKGQWEGISHDFSTDFQQDIKKHAQKLRQGGEKIASAETVLKNYKNNLTEKLSQNDSHISNDFQRLKFETYIQLAQKLNVNLLRKWLKQKIPSVKRHKTM